MRHVYKNTNRSEMSALATQIWTGHNMDPLPFVQIEVVGDEVTFNSQLLQRMARLDNMNTVLFGGDQSRPNET